MFAKHNAWVQESKDSEKRRERKAEIKTVVKKYTHKWGREIEVNGGMALPKGNHLSQSQSKGKS